MSVSNLSASHQNYLKALWSLGEWSGEPIKASSIAAKTGVKLSSASDAVKRLKEMGLVEHSPYGAVSLTEQGRAHALAMVRRHRLIETFLVNVLQYRWDEVHDEAEVLEHAVSDVMIERIDRILGYPRRDPHGDPIPSASGAIDSLDAVPLVSVAPHQRVRVERISDADPQLLQFFADHGLVYGAELEVHPPAPFSDTIDVVLPEGIPLSLGQSACEAVWVSVLEHESTPRALPGASAED